jgi:hypothetical protein
MNGEIQINKHGRLITIILNKKMSTRSLTMVINEGKTKVAQYGQNDGYPQGQGKTILEFLQECDLEEFKEKLKEVVFLSPEEIEQIRGEEISVVNTDAKVLKLIYDGQAKKLVDNSDFAKHSLFCEWAYVLDLDKGALEVYRGFNREPLEKGDRFYNKKDIDKDYYPVRIIKTYSLKDLPEMEQFFKDLTPDKTRKSGLSR